MTMRKITELAGRGVRDAFQPSPGELAFELTDGKVTVPVELPEGPQGPPGRDGANVLPTDQAVAESLAVVSGEVSANSYGADPAASWQTNRDAFQAANDAARDVGGGTVTASPGVYEVKGIIRDSRVRFHLPGVTLKSPDGTVPNLMTTRLLHRSGNAVKGSNQVIVTAGGVAGIEVGTRVAVFGAGGILDSQETRLTRNTNGVDTSIELVNVTGLANAGTLLVESELISYTGRSGGLLTGVTRGAYGTTPAPHLATAPIGIARRLYATVIEISGNTLILDRPAVSGGIGVPISFGTVGGGVTGFPTLDGNKPLAGAQSSVFTYLGQLSSWATYDMRIINGETGGFMLSRGAAYNRGLRIHLHNCSVPTASKGSAFWLYQGCENNHFDEVEVTGHSWVGVYLDDRTSISEEGWDGPNRYNTFVTINIDVTESQTGVLNIVSGEYNRFFGGRLKSPKVGLNCSNNSQGSTAGGGSVGNDFSGFTFHVGETPYTFYASGNVLHDSFVESSHPSYPGIVANGNTIYAVSPSPGVAPLMPLSHRVNLLENTRLDDWIGWTIPPNTGTGSAGGRIDLSETAAMFNPIVYNSTPVPVGAGVPIAAAVEVTVPDGHPPITLAAVVIAYRNLSASPVVTNSVVGPTITIASGETRILTAAIPATAALTEGARLQIQMRSNSLAGRRIIVSPKPVLERGVTQAGPLFNGDTTGAMWVGAEGVSQSVLF